METKENAYSYITECSLGLRHAGQLSLSKACRSVSRSVYRCCGDKTLSLQELFALPFLRRYAAYLKYENLLPSTIAYYMKTLRSIYNHAVEEQKIPLVHGLFTGLIQTPGPTDKRALTAHAVARLFTGDLSTVPRLQLCRDFFVLSLYLQGMPFIDLFHLLKKEVMRDKIVYQRRKTSKNITVNIIPEARQLLDKLKSNDPDSPYFFAVITEFGEAGFKQYESLSHRINCQLKKVAEHLGINENITTHVARHTWATIAYHGGTTIGLVSQGMGHQSEEMTRTYLASFTESQLGGVNRVVLRSILMPIINNEIENVTPEMKEDALRKLQEIDEYFKKNPSCWSLLRTNDRDLNQW